MFTHRFDHTTTKRAELHWLLLGFNGGFINVGGFLATGRFVTHVTGFATLFGVEYVKAGWREAIGVLSVPIFFLLGAFIAGLLIDRQVFKNKVPHYDYVMALCAISLIVAGYASYFIRFVNFGVAAEISQSYLVSAALCLASGLQNAALTSSSGSSVRTTHLTGVTTDLGLGLARLLSLDPKDERAGNERYANRLRIGTIFSFTLGSALGAYVFYHTERMGFIIPAAIAIFASWEGHKTKRDNKTFRAYLTDHVKDRQK